MMETDARVRPWYTKSDLEWLSREDAGVNPNPVPDCAATCVCCGKPVYGSSGSIALHSKCDIALSKVPLLRKQVYDDFHSGRANACGQRLIDKSQQWDATEVTP